MIAEVVLFCFDMHFLSTPQHVRSRFNLWCLLPSPQFKLADQCLTLHCAIKMLSYVKIQKLITESSCHMDHRTLVLFLATPWAK